MTGFADHLAQALRMVGVRGVVTVVQPRASLVRVRRLANDGDGPVTFEVRVSRRLEELGESAIPAIVAFVARRQGARARLEDLAKCLKPLQSQRVTRLVAQGRFHDLGEIETAVRARHLPDISTASIGWTRVGSSGAIQSIRLGSYDEARGGMRVHERLDHPEVPAWFIGFVVFHEYLHSLPELSGLDGRRRLLHSPQFRFREQSHPDFEAARDWMEMNLPRLLSAQWCRLRT